jgi:hypothetical protein
MRNIGQRPEMPGYGGELALHDESLEARCEENRKADARLAAWRKRQERAQ